MLLLFILPRRAARLPLLPRWSAMSGESGCRVRVGFKPLGSSLLTGPATSGRSSLSPSLVSHVGFHVLLLGHWPFAIAAWKVINHYQCWQKGWDCQLGYWLVIQRPVKYIGHWLPVFFISAEVAVILRLPVVIV